MVVILSSLIFCDEYLQLRTPVCPKLCNHPQKNGQKFCTFVYLGAFETHLNNNAISIQNDTTPILDVAGKFIGNLLSSPSSKKKTGIVCELIAR